MFDDLGTVLNRCRTTLAADIAGGAALLVILFAGLHLPVFV